jgi:hypothetical protein
MGLIHCYRNADSFRNGTAIHSNGIARRTLAGISITTRTQNKAKPKVTNNVTVILSFYDDLSDCSF